MSRIEYLQYTDNHGKRILKRCPFCGFIAGLAYDKWKRRFYVRCELCKAKSDETKIPGEAADKWNERTPEQSENEFLVPNCMKEHIKGAGTLETDEQEETEGANDA